MSLQHCLIPYTCLCFLNSPVVKCKVIGYRIGLTVMDVFLIIHEYSSIL